MPTIGITGPRATSGPEGNRITAVRWAQCLRTLGCNVVAWPRPEPVPLDALIALHAHKSHDQVLHYRRSGGRAPLIVACTGTDLYRGDGLTDRSLATLGHAAAIVVLQPNALEELPPQLRGKAKVIYQSVRVLRQRPTPPPDRFEVCVIANLRAVKDPLLPARATQLLRAESRLHITLYGDTLDPILGRACRSEAERNPRFHWAGPKPHDETLAGLAGSHLLVSPSRVEGGSNVVSEALAHDVPVLATAIRGTLGLLGEDHPGTFPVGDWRGLASRLEHLERHSEALEELREAGAKRAWITSPTLERASWAELLDVVLAKRQDVRGARPWT